MIFMPYELPQAKRVRKHLCPQLKCPPILLAIFRGRALLHGRCSRNSVSM